MSLCQDLEDPNNGVVVYTGGLGDSTALRVANFYCYDGYVLRGNRERRCYHGNWSGLSSVLCGKASLILSLSNCSGYLLILLFPEESDWSPLPPPPPQSASFSKTSSPSLQILHSILFIVCSFLHVYIFS